MLFISNITIFCYSNHNQLIIYFMLRNGKVLYLFPNDASLFCPLRGQKNHLQNAAHIRKRSGEHFSHLIHCLATSSSFCNLKKVRCFSLLFYFAQPTAAHQLIPKITFFRLYTSSEKANSNEDSWL